DTEAAKRHVELSVRAAIEGLGSHDLVACFKKAGKRDELGGLAAPHRERAYTAFEGGHALFEGGGGGVHDARIDVAEALKVEQRRRVRGVVEDVRGGLVDRHSAGSGIGIGPLSGMQCSGGEAKTSVRSRRHLFKVAQAERCRLLCWQAD